MTKLKVDLWELDELIETTKMMEEDAAFAANKNIKDPKRKRTAKKHLDFSSSLQHYLTELKALKQKS